jgi:hypothetical protein
MGMKAMATMTNMMVNMAMVTTANMRVNKRANMENMKAMKTTTSRAKRSAKRVMKKILTRANVRSNKVMKTTTNLMVNMRTTNKATKVAGTRTTMANMKAMEAMGGENKEVEMGGALEDAIANSCH